MARGAPGPAGVRRNGAHDTRFDDRSGAPRYMQLASVLKHEIASGKWPIGNRASKLKSPNWTSKLRNSVNGPALSARA